MLTPLSHDQRLGRALGAGEMKVDAGGLRSMSTTLPRRDVVGYGAMTFVLAHRWAAPRWPAA